MTTQHYATQTLLIAEVPGAGYDWFLHRPFVPRGVCCSRCGQSLSSLPYESPKFDTLDEALDWCALNGVFLDAEPEHYEP